MWTVFRKIGEWFGDMFRLGRIILFLLEHKTQKVEHKESSFFGHLFGTYRVLKKWHLKEEVQLAGLLHSVYGTSYFRRTTIPPSEREKIVALIGSKAERLVYLFSVFDRARGWKEADQKLILVQVSSGEPVIITREELTALAQIECANFLDQKLQPSSYIVQLSALFKVC